MFKANEVNYQVKAKSGISPVEAGYGLVHTDTIVATTEDELIVAPSSIGMELDVEGKTTTGPVAGLELDPGIYNAILKVKDGNTVLETKNMKLILADPACVCRRFGARYGSLEYDRPVVTGKGGRTAPWESLWRTGGVSDIVVDFDGPYKFVLWRGMSYAPSWAADNVMTSLFFAETLEPGILRDCCEMMSDRECRYSHARVIHSSDARVVIHWRCALADPAYNICRNQWADEMFYIYPDGTICRNVTIYIDPNDERAWKNCPNTGKRIPVSMLDGMPGKRTFNDMEFIAVNPMGSAPEDNLLPGALTLLDCKDFSETYEWPSPPDFSQVPMPELGEYIFRMNYKHRPEVFVASHADNMKISFMGNSGMIYEAGALVQDDRWVNVSNLPSMFGNFIHWPVTRGYGTTALTDRSAFQDRPTHTFLGHASNAPVEVCDNGAVTWVWLTGIAPEDEGTLRAKVKAWVHPVLIEGAGYDSKQRAYVVENTVDEAALTAGNGEVTGPVFVLCGWDCMNVSVLVNDYPLEQSAMAVGVERHMGGVRTVITLRQDLAPASRIVIKKKA